MTNGGWNTGIAPVVASSVLVQNNGQTVASIDENGTITGQDFYVNGTEYIQGTDLATYIAEQAATTNSVICWGSLSGTTATVTTETIYYSLSFLAQPGRRYTINCENVAFRGPGAGRIWLNRNGGTVSVGGTGSELYAAFTKSYHGFVFGNSDTAVTPISIGFSIANPGSGTYVDSSNGWAGTAGSQYWVEDIGPHTASSGSTSPLAPPGKQTYDYTFSNADAYSYTGPDAKSPVVPSWQRSHNGYNYQGNAWAGNQDPYGNQLSFFTNFSEWKGKGILLSDIAGSVVNFVQITAKNYGSWYSTFHVWWGYHNISSFGWPTPANPNNEWGFYPWNTGATQTVDATSWLAVPLQNGAVKGIVLGPSDVEYDLDKYCWMGGPVYIRVNYTK